MFAASKTAAAQAAAAATDPNFRNVALLLNDTGTNGQQNNTFLDSSSNNFTITRNGTPTQGSMTPYWPDGQWSNYFPGSATISVPNNAALQFGSGNFTIEFWFNSASVTGIRQFLNTSNAGGSPNNSYAIVTSGTSILYYLSSTGTSWNIAGGVSAGTVVLGTWNHLALVRNGNTITPYLNGIAGTPTTSSASLFAFTSALTIGAVSGGTDSYVGNISNFRIVKGTALYTSNFTPSTTPLTAVSGTSLLTCQSNRFRDASSNNFAITVTGNPQVTAFDPFSSAASYSTSLYGGSGFFPGGNTNYLSVASSTNLLMTGDFTLECWCYVPAGQSQTAYSNIFNGPATPNQGIYSSFGSNNNFGYYGASPSIHIQTGVRANDGAWHHLAVVRNGSTVTMYVDGISRGTPVTNTSTIDLGSAASARVGAGSNGATDNPFTGFISNLRIVNGTAVYTSNFTPPTSPVTAISGTALLLNFSNAGIFDAASLSNLTTVGNAQASTTRAKWGSSSMYFDGSGDYLAPTNSPLFAFGTGDFTIEYWIYSISWATQPTIVDTRSAGNIANGYSDFVLTSGIFGLYLNNSVVYTSSSTIPLNTWTHIAVSRQGTSLRVFFNGVQNGSTVTNSTNMSNPSCLIGNNVGLSGGAGTNFFSGYLEDVRITRGARYTSNFTVPTAPFPTR